MLIKEIRDIAKQHGITPGTLSKGDLIRSIQRNEGNFDCFESASTSGECSEMMCVWRNDCLGKKEAAVTKPAAAKKAVASKGAPKAAVTKKATPKKAPAKKK